MKATAKTKNSIYALIVILALSVFISCNNDDEMPLELIGRWKGIRVDFPSNPDASYAYDSTTQVYNFHPGFVTYERHDSTSVSENIKILSGNRIKREHFDDPWIYGIKCDTLTLVNQKRIVTLYRINIYKNK